MCCIVEPWICGCEFNIQSLCDVTGLSTRQVESAKKNSIVREKLNDMRTGKRGNYKKYLNNFTLYTFFLINIIRELEYKSINIF